MGFFTRKSKWDMLVESGAIRNAGKMGAGLVAGFASLTAVSAAISASRHSDQQ